MAYYEKIAPVSTMAEGADGKKYNAVVSIGAAANAPISTFASTTPAYTAAALTTAPVTMADIQGGRGCYIVVNVTAGATLALTVKVQGKDPSSATYVDIPGAITASITGAGVTVLEVYPGITATTNSSVSYRLPTSWRVVPVHGNANAATYTIGIDVLS